MIPASFAILVAGVAIGVLALLAFMWAWRRGEFDDIDAQSRVIFDARDYRLERPWETPEQQEERRRIYGDPVRPAPGEWGGPA